MYFYFCLKISGQTILHRFLSKLFHNLGPPYANNHLSYVTMLGISWWKSVAHSTAFLLMGRNL